MRPVGLAVAALALVAAACAGATPEHLPDTSISTSLGVLTGTDAENMMAGICDLERGPDLQEANTIFYGRVHERLHVLAAAAAKDDRATAGALLQAKEKVEQDLAGPALPASFGDDAAALEAAARRALVSIKWPGLTCNS